MTVTISSLSSVSFDGVAEVTGINNAGVVVGEEGTAAIWRNGSVSGLAGLESAQAINDLGQVAGMVYGAGGWRAALWQNGAATELATLGGTVTAYSESANDINDAGQIVGESASAGGLVEACLWQNGTATNLGTLAGGTSPVGLGYANSAALAVNAAGQIAGFSLTTGNVYHAVLWQSGTLTDLGVLAPGDQSFATAINASGEIVGYDMPSSLESHAVLWQNGKMTDLGTLPGDNYSTAEAINAAGIVVGQAGDYSEPSGNHAVMWQNGKIYDLNTLISPTSGWYLQTADAINDNGMIVGRGGMIGGSGDGTYALILTGTAAVVGVTVQTALQSTVISSVAIVDSGANVLAGLDGLETMRQNEVLTSITLADSTPPAWSLTAARFDEDTDALAVLLSPVSLTVTGAVSAYAASQLPGSIAVTAPLAVSDTATNIGYFLDGLAAAASAGQIGTITDSDAQSGATWEISVSVSQAENDGAAFAHFSGKYVLDVQGSSYLIANGLDQLDKLVAAGTVSQISINPYTEAPGPLTLAISSDQLAHDQAALGAMTVQSPDLAITPSSATASIDGAGYAATVVLPGVASLYTVTPDGTGTGFTLSGGGVDDKIANVTALQFADHTVIVASQTPSAPGGVSSFQVATLYSAVLDREPDVSGLSFYEKVAAQGQAGITSFAEWFLQSPEYTTAHSYAQTTEGDAQFITDTYRNLLHRAPGTGDVAWYQANVIAPVLANVTPGTAAYAQAELLAHATLLTYFSQSAEFRGDVAVTAQTPADAQHWLVLI